jgi:hypothetical protein
MSKTTTYVLVGAAALVGLYLLTSKTTVFKAKAASSTTGVGGILTGGGNLLTGASNLVDSFSTSSGSDDS